MREFLKYTLPSLTLDLSISPFNWWRFDLGRSWAAAWITVGPIDFGLHWGSVD